jgi:hypothetical protein
LIIDQFYAAWDKEDISGKRGMDFNSQDLQRFKCSLLLTGDNKLKNCDQEFLHFFSSAGGLHNTLAAFFYGYFKTFEHCYLLEGWRWGVVKLER